MGNHKRSNYKTEILIVLSIFTFALLIRLFYLFEIKRFILFNKFILDSYYYNNWARDIASGNWIGKDVFYGMPFYPYFLGLIYFIFSGSIFIAKLIQFIIGSLSPIFIYLIAKRFFNKPIALIAAFIASTYSMFIFYEGELIDSGISLFLYLLSMYLLLLAGEKHKGKIYFLAGIVFGLSALSRAGILLWIPFVLFWIIFLEKTKRRLAVSMQFLLGIILIVSSVTLRNYMVSKDMVFITAHSGINFYIGNNENADGTFNVPSSMSTNSEDLIKDAKLFAERYSGRLLKPSEVSKYWFSKSFEFIKKSPLKFTRLLAKKAILFWNTYEIPDAQNYYFIKREFNFFKFPFWSFIVISPLALLGIGLALYNWRRLFLLYTFVISYTGSIILYFINSRYRLPVIPALIIFSSFALWWIYKKIKSKEYGIVIISLVVFIFLFIITNIHSQKPNFSASFNNLGDIFSKEGKLEEASVYYQKSIQENPYESKPYNDLGLVYLEKNQVDEATKMFTRAIELDPHNARAHCNLGLIYFKKGQYRLAIEEFMRALELNPGLSEAHNNLGAVYIQISEYEKAIQEFKEAIKVNSSDISAHYNLGLIYAKRGLVSEAIHELRYVLTIAPNHQGANELLLLLKSRP